ncbi:hypothetical protein [Saccharopolyspora cebuensis]|uniref:Integral membrane protein n=1 Tax=Saccharopolyspora cebuensis TaxID=418759 RepID=A0ABV4CGV7_9PSEU
MRTTTDERGAGRRRVINAVCFLGLQAVLGIGLGGLWLALMLADAADQGYGAVDYLAPVVVVAVGVASGACALLTARGSATAAVPTAVTQVFAMAIGAYALYRGSMVGLTPLLAGLFVFAHLYHRDAVDE